MGYEFIIKGGLRVKRDATYPWPCADLPNRTIDLFTSDVLTLDPKTGKYMKHTGLGCFNIVIPAEDLEPWDRDVELTLL